jgi:tetratricopeptide (TPR) repeat protein
MATVAQKKRKRLIQMAEGYLDLAVVFEDRWSLSVEHRRKMASRAITCLNKISNPGGHRAYLLFLKGQAHRVAGRFRQATNFFEQSTKLEPENIHCLLALAWCYKRTDLIPQAIESLEKAVLIDAASAISHYNLACYWALLNKIDPAVMHLSMAIDLDEAYRDLVAGEHDFDLIRKNPGFQHLLEVGA